MSADARGPNVCHGVLALLIGKFSGDGTPTVVGESGVRVESRTDQDRAEGSRADERRGRVAVALDGETTTLTRAAAIDLRAALGDCLRERREFVHTAGEQRADGRYVVSRRGAESSGHRKVFETFSALELLYDDLPGEFVATDLERPGLSDGRCHLVVRHFAEHPAFECGLVCRQPLTACKGGERG